MLVRLIIYTSLATICMLPQQEAYGEDAVLLNQYDANGSLVSGDGKFYRYNDANQLVMVCEDAVCAKAVAEYSYDHTGQRVKKIENGVTTYYLGKHYGTQVTQGQIKNTSYFFANGERVAKKDATGTNYYHPDHLGGVSAVTDTSGQIVSSTSYLPFGEVRQGGTENYYTGKENDKAAGLYNFEARYVSPELRHFTQADIAEPDFDDPQDLNRYAYVGNNPLSFVDPDGHKKKKKAKLSKREKWMIAHGVDPDHDKTSLKKAKALEKAGKKYRVVAKNNAGNRSLAGGGESSESAIHEGTGSNNSGSTGGESSINGSVSSNSNQLDDTMCRFTSEDLERSESVGNAEYREITGQDNECSKPAQILNNSYLSKQCCIAHDNCYQANFCNETSWRNFKTWEACQWCNAKVFACIAAAMALEGNSSHGINPVIFK